MKKFLLFLCFFIALPVFCVGSKTEISVLKVYDGDTILAKIKESGSVFRIRLIDIDCFEGTFGDRAKYQARKFKLSEEKIVEGGNIAGDILRDELNGKKVYFEFKGIDKYNRALGVVYADKINMNKRMLKTQYCEVY